MPISNSNSRSPGAAPGAAQGGERRHIQSIGVGFRLIRCLEEATGPLSLKDLAERAGMSASQAHLYLASFAQLGMVRQDRVSRYELGPYALQLGLAALRRMDIVAIAKEPMYALNRHTSEAAYLSVWGNRGPSIVRKVDGLRPIPMQLRVGYVLPLLSSATGRLFLSFLPRAETAAIVKEELAAWPAHARPDKPTAQKIDALIAETRHNGMTQTESLHNEGFAAMSAPILDHEGTICASITLIGTIGLFDTDPDGEDAMALRSTTTEISRQLGFREEDRAPNNTALRPEAKHA
jgi:DNA-binding IclR family transcriptional regulator